MRGRAGPAEGDPLPNLDAMPIGGGGELRSFERDRAGALVDAAVAVVVGAVTYLSARGAGVVAWAANAEAKAREYGVEVASHAIDLLLGEIRLIPTAWPVVAHQISSVGSEASAARVRRGAVKAAAPGIGAVPGARIGRCITDEVSSLSAIGVVNELARDSRWARALVSVIEPKKVA